MIYAIDIDGVLCNDTLGDYENSIPNKKAIEKVNNLYINGNIIKIFTARGSGTGLNWEEFTTNQLNEWGVNYHELIFGKPHMDVLIDDKAINIKDWI